MDWIKRNLYFLIGGVVALALMGMAGFFLFSKWRENNVVMQQLNADYEQLRTLNGQDPHPGAGDIDNIAAAKKQAQQLQALIAKARGQFAPILPIPYLPDQTNLTDRDFSSALSRTLEQLGKDATNASVTLPPNFYFSFSAQNARVTYASGSLNRLATQLGEVKAICDVLYAAKVNSLDSIRREKVSADDSMAMQTDYLEKKSVTNELAVLSPYDVTFRCFSPELAAVLAGFASSPHGLNVKAVNVELAPAAPAADQQAAPIYTPQPVMVQPSGVDPTRGAAEASFRSRYGIDARGRGRGGPAPAQPAPPPQTIYLPQNPAGAQPKGGLQTVLDEKQLKVNLSLYVVKLLPKQEAK